MSPNLDEKSEPREPSSERSEGSAQGEQGNRPRGSTQHSRSRSRRRPNPSQAEQATGEAQGGNRPPESRKPGSAENAPTAQTYQTGAPRGQQSSRRRRSRGPYRERGDGGGQKSAQQNEPQTGDPSQRSQASQSAAQKSGNRPDQRRGNRGSQRRDDRSSESSTNDPTLPPPPDPVEPTFIGPEFRRIEYPELLSRTPPRNNEVKTGASPNQRRNKRRGIRGGKGTANQPKQSNEAAPSGKANDQPGSETRSPGNRRNNQPPRGQIQRSKARRGRVERSDQQAPRADGNTYVSLSNQYSFTRPAPSVPIPTDRGIKLRSQRGGTSKNWWARRWIDAMERLVDPARLQRGRSYARSGQVLSIKETRAGVEALVQGSRPQPYKVSIQVTHLNNNQWDRVVDALSEQALFTAQLLAGEMPAEIESAFETAGVSLFPNRAGDLNTSCSCPDWANPCKHVAASQYILGDRFDDDPFLLFRMRGRTQEQIMDALRQRRGGQEFTVEEVQEEIPSAPGLDQEIGHFWDPAEPLDSFPLTITPPTIDMPMLKRLGEPAFLAGELIQQLLKPVYDSFTRQALRAAYVEDEPIESNPSEENGN